MEYMLVSGVDVALFEANIDMHFDQGWELYGNLVVTVHTVALEWGTDIVTTYYQAMVKTAGDED
jgi:hypothetical protein